MAKSVRFTLLFAITAIAAPPFLPQGFAAEELNRRAIERRAVEAVIWGMPAVNFDLMAQRPDRTADDRFRKQRKNTVNCFS